MVWYRGTPYTWIMWWTINYACSNAKEIWKSLTQSFFNVTNTTEIFLFIFQMSHSPSPQQTRTPQITNINEHIMLLATYLSFPLMKATEQSRILAISRLVNPAETRNFSWASVTRREGLPLLPVCTSGARYWLPWFRNRKQNQNCVQYINYVLKTHLRTVLKCESAGCMYTSPG